MKEDCVYYIPPRRDEDESCICWEHTNWNCEGCKRYKNKYKKANADRIRSMTDEELAQFLYDCTDYPELDWWKRWIKQEDWEWSE